MEDPPFAPVNNGQFLGDTKRLVNRFVNSPAPNASKMRPKMLGIKLSFVGSGFDFFAVPTLFNVKKFCLITLQKSKPRKRNGVQEAAGSTPVTRTKQMRLESVNFRVFFLLFENFFEPDYTAGLLVPVTNASKNASKTQDK